MVRSWSNWKRYPNAQSGDHVEAPIGPGVYEVRHAGTGELVAFGHSGNVANAISELKFDNGSSWKRLFRRDSATPRVSDLEYRTYAATTPKEAKIAANRLLGLRQSYWRQRLGADWISGSPH